MSDRADSATHCAVHGRQARLGEGRISTSPRFLTLKLLPFSAPPGGIYLINSLENRGVLNTGRGWLCPVIFKFKKKQF